MMSDWIKKESHIPGTEGEPRFTDADEAVTWYNGWIQASPTDPPESEKDPEFKWDPVLKWYDKAGKGLYWYIVGTKESQSLVVESEETFRDWANQYYWHYEKKHGREKAESLTEKGRVVVARIPDLPASTPEAETLLDSAADEPPAGKPGPGNEKDTDRASWIDTDKIGDYAIIVSRLAEEQIEMIEMGWVSRAPDGRTHWFGDNYDQAWAYWQRTDGSTEPQYLQKGRRKEMAGMNEKKTDWLVPEDAATDVQEAHVAAVKAEEAVEPHQGLYIGTSGFSYKHWEGEFYPEDLPGKQRLAFYATKFPTIEVSSTFHNFPEFRVLQRWYDSTPHGFTFSVRGPHEVTHVRKLVDCGGIMEAFMRRLETLKEKLAVVTFQMQESAAFDGAALKGFLESLPKGHHYSMEFRSEPWYNEETYDLLAKHDVALVTVGHSDKGIHPTQPATWGYLRLSGNNPDYKKNSYSDQDLKNWRGIVSDSPSPTFVYFNNEYKAFAAHNATAMMDLMKVSWAPVTVQKRKKDVLPRRDLPKSLPGPKGPQNTTKDKYNSNPKDYPDYADDGSGSFSTDPWAAKKLKYHFPFQPAAPHTK